MLAVFCLLLSSAFAADSPSPLACPATVDTRPFERVNIYNGKPGGEEYDLAPDDEKHSGRKFTQTWFLKNYRDMGIFVRCRYRGTTAVSNLDVPASYQKCTFTFELDQKNNIAGKPEFSCQ
jgi:hypothetical protein